MRPCVVLVRIGEATCAIFAAARRPALMEGRAGFEYRKTVSAGGGYFAFPME